MLFKNSVRKAPGVRSAVAGAVVVLAGGVAGWAQAQQTLEPVVVTATRSETSLQKAPVGATVITAMEMQTAGVRDANEAVRRLAGVAARSDLSGGRENSLSLRGFGATSELNLVVLVNGVRASEAQMVSARLSAIPVDQIERIEIVRGGNSVLWGAGASAGVINVILKRDREPGLHGLVSLALESNEGHEINANVSHATGAWWIAADVKRLDTQGARENTDYRQDVGGFQMAGEFGDVRLHARLQKEHQQSGLAGPLTFAQFAQNSQQASTPMDRAQTDETTVSVGAEWAIGSAKLKLDVAARDRASRFEQFWGTDTWTSKTDQITPSLEHTITLGDLAKLQYTVGMAWEQWSLSRPSGATSDQSSQAAFAQFNVTLPSQTRLSVGARHETADSGSAFAGVSSYDQKDDLNAWELGVSQSLSKRIDVYMRAARSYRLATADEYGFTVGGLPLRPQINRDWESGIKWMSGPQSATLRVFRQDTRDEIDFDPIARRNGNLAPLRRQGIELDARWSWSNGWSTTFTGQALSARFLEGTLAGKQVPLVAPQTLSWRVAYQINDRHRVGGGLQYLSPIRFNDDVRNQCGRKIPSSTLLDARYEWTNKAWTASLGVTNLTDKQTYNMAYSCANGSLYPEPGRIWRATVSRNF